MHPKKPRRRPENDLFNQRLEAIIDLRHPLVRLPALMMPVILLVGIYGGVTTPTEAAALAALYAFLVSTVFYRSVSLRLAYETVRNSAKSTAAVGFLIAALHHAGIATLTHTPSPMGFLGEILGRPTNEKAYVLLPVGYPAPGCLVPDITKKPLDEILVRV